MPSKGNSLDIIAYHIFVYNILTHSFNRMSLFIFILYAYAADPRSKLFHVKQLQIYLQKDAAYLPKVHIRMDTCLQHVPAGANDSLRKADRQRQCPELWWTGQCTLRRWKPLFVTTARLKCHCQGRYAVHGQKWYIGTLVDTIPQSA